MKLLAWLHGSDDLMPEELELRRWSFAAGAVVGLTALVFLIWGVFAPLHGAVVAPGQVRVENYRQLVQHQEGGIIKRILVHNGDRVKKDQDLIEIEDLRVSANSGIIEQNINGEQARQARLIAERDFHNQIDFPGKLLAKKDDPFVHDILKKEQELFQQRRKTVQQQLDILAEQITEAGHEVEATRQQVAADAVSSKSMDDELKANQTLLDKGFISPTRMYALQRSLADYQSREAEHRADLSRAQQKQTDLRLKVEEVRNSTRQVALGDLKDSFSKMSDLQEQLRPALDAEQRQVLRSPVDGVVVNLKANTIGASIGPRDPIMEIVPDNQKLIVEVRLPPESIMELAPGMAADVRLLAYQTRTTPLVEGRLKYLSADVLTEQNGTTYYLGQIELDPLSLAEAEISVIQPGMPAEVYIRTHPRSAFQYLVDPISQSLERAFRER
jgi:membrane fusion protein, epimerase transport system